MLLLDANVLMEAARRYYAFDLAPTFWNWLSHPSHAATLASASVIKEEVVAGTGDLVTWAHGLPDSFWIPDDEASTSQLTNLAQWATDPSRPFLPAAVDEFMDSGDIRLVSVAAAHGHSVVTHETSDPNCRRRVKIPEACAAVGVTCVQPFEAFRALGMSL